MAFLNTANNGNVRSIIFQENGEWFGVALEFNIVETGTSPQEVSVLLDEAIQGYIEAAQKSKHSIRVLNQEVDPDYEALWKVGNSEREEDKSNIYRLSAQPVRSFA
jgi:predicted RNase H-like HicB family nuclease